MKLLSALTAYIESLPGVSRDAMSSCADLGTLVPTGIDLGHGFEVGRFRYDALVTIENFPAVQGDLLLPALVVWLAQNDPDRERRGLGDLEIDISLLDDQLVSVDIEVRFDEDLCVVPDPKGVLRFNGQNWRVADVPIDMAEELDSLEKK